MRTVSYATLLRQQLWLLVLLVIALAAGIAAAQNTNTSNANGNTNSSGTRTTTTANANNTNTQAGGTTTSTSTSTTSTTTATSAGFPTSEQFAQVKVKRVFKSTKTGEEIQQSAGSNETGLPEVELGDQISLEIDNLKYLIQRSEAFNPHKRILLFLDGRPVTNLSPFPPSDPEKKHLVFVLKRTDEAREVWAFLLGSPRFTLRQTDVSVGLDGEYAVTSDAKVALRVIPMGPFIFWVFLFLVLIVIFWVTAKRSDVLRDSGGSPPNNERKAFSLARMQAAWWFFIVLACYLLIGIITGDFSTSITGTVLVLLGISAGQVVGSAAVDAGSGANAAPPPAAGPPAPQTAQATTGNWLEDIITDKNGVGFHRFQNAVWTLVLGIIFIVQVYKVLAMPQFSETLLGLMGISAGTFLGMKINENK
ncbi:MAG: hypothetical protein ACJ74G_18495 [Blastocatellia bacterium]